MSRSARKMKTIRSAALFYNERKPEAVKALSVVRRLLRARGVRVVVAPPAGDASGAFPGRCDLAIALGGDGTVLRAARLLAPFSIPLLGINTGGGLGFLSAVDLPGLRKRLGLILKGGFNVQERRMLEVEVKRGVRRVFGPHVALNDCVLRAGDQARAVTIKAFCAGRYVAAYFGDGLIISTPTGSTAYALAVGGPVVAPGLDAVLLAPICPHTLTQRPLILPGSDPVVLRLARRNPQDFPQALVSIDGQIEYPLKVGDEARIEMSKRPFRLLLDPARSYYEVLRAKLRWGERGGRG